MAIPLEAAPATVLPKSNLAQLGYQLGQQQQAQELAEADILNKQLEALGDVGFWAEMDSPIMGQMTNMFLETAAEAAADPTNRELAIRLAREKAQIQRYARKSEYDQKVHIANEQFARQNPDFAGKDAWAQSLIGRGQGEVVRDDDGTFRINGEMVENAFPSVSMIGKKREETTLRDWVNTLDVGSMTYTDENGVKGIRPKGVSEYVTTDFQYLPQDQQLDLILAEERRIHPRATLESFLQMPEEYQQQVQARMLANAIDLYEGELNSSTIQPKDDGKGKKIDNWGIDRFDISTTPDGVTDGFASVKIPATTFIPSSEGRRDKAYFINGYEVGKDGTLRLTGYQLSRAGFEELIGNVLTKDQAENNESISGEELKNVFSQAKSKPISEVFDVSGDKNEFLTALKKKEKGIKRLSRFDDFVDWSWDYNDSPIEDSEETSGGVMSQFN